MPKVKQYSVAVWTKRATQFNSQPEIKIAEAVRLFVAQSEHPEINFTGTPLELVNAIYLEWRKRAPYPGLYPTPLAVARQAADWLGVQPGQRVLDPGSGFGNLSWAVQQCGGVPIMVEFGWTAYHLAQAVWDQTGLAITYADFLDGYHPPTFDAVIVNPAFGPVFGHADAARDFMTRIADLSPSGTRVAAILPGDYLRKERPGRHVAMQQRYRILRECDLPPTTFKPLTTIRTTLYLLDVIDGGRHST